MDRPADTRRMWGLDVLRGVAVLMVLAVHAPWSSEVRAGALRKLLPLGSYGVDLFFVLSGFLISGLLFAELARSSQVDVRRFWLRRGFKIWPSYYVAYGSAFAITCAVHARGGRLTPDFVIRSLPNFVFAQNYVWPEYRWVASWSLAVEEHFYAVLPLVIVALASCRALHALPWVCLAICAAAPLFRLYGTDPVLSYLQTHCRADGLCYGVLIGYWRHYHREAFVSLSRQRWAILTILLLSLAYAYEHRLSDPWMRSFGVSALSLSFAGIVTIAAQEVPSGGVHRGLTTPLAWVGVYSYTIYLAQVVSGVALAVIGAVIGSTWRSSAPLFVLLSILGGVVLSHAVERPFLQLRERRLPARKVAVMAGSPEKISGPLGLAVQQGGRMA